MVNNIDNNDLLKAKKIENDNKNDSESKVPSAAKQEDFKKYENKTLDDVMNNLISNPNLNAISSNSQNSQSLPKDPNPKKSLFDIAENSSSTSDFKKPESNLKSISMNNTIKSKKKNEEFDIEEYLNNPQEQQIKLPETFNLASIVSQTTGTTSNFVQTTGSKNNEKKENKNTPEVNEITNAFKLNDVSNKNLPEEIENEKKEIINLKKENNVYIIFNVNSIKEEELPEKFIVYNFEQLTTDRKWDYSYFIKCKKALLVLDYSLENIKIFFQRDITAYHLPFGWCSTMEPSYNLNKKNIDVVFLGSINKTRLNTITNVSLRNSKANIYIHNKCFRDEFEKVICSSKIGMNIHYYEGKTILELTRIIPLVCAGVIVVSERSNDIFYDKIFNKVIKFCKKEDLPKVVKEEIYNYDLSKALKKKKKLKKLLNFEKIVKQNIDVFKKFI